MQDIRAYFCKGSLVAIVLLLQTVEYFTTILLFCPGSGSYLKAHSVTLSYAPALASS